MYLPQYVNNSHCTLADMFYIEQLIIIINTLDSDISCKTKQCGSLHKKLCSSIWSSDFNNGGYVNASTVVLSTENAAA
jgi:hypothetical protein